MKYSNEQIITQMVLLSEEERIALLRELSLKYPSEFKQATMTENEVKCFKGGT